MTYNPFYQLFVTPVLPFDDDGNVDTEAYRSFLRRFLTPSYIDEGMAIVANPEAGELFCLDYDERRQVIQVAKEECAGRVPVLGGVVDVTTAGYVRTARDAADLGVDGLFVFPPIGAGDITQSWNAELYPEVFVDILRALANEVDLPMVVHATGQVSAQYGVGLPAGVTRRILEDVPNVVGWKMTYNYDGYRSISRLIRDFGRPVAVLAAVGKYFHENLANKAFDGSCSGAYNYALEPMMEHIQAWRRGDVERATEIWNGGLAELQEYVFGDFSRLHVRYKAGAWLRGFIPNPVMRAPMPKPRRAEVDRLVKLFQNLNLSVIDKDQIEEMASRLRLEA